MKKVGDKFKIRRFEFIVVSVFEDEGETYFVAKRRVDYGYSYKIFAYHKDGSVYQRS